MQRTTSPVKNKRIPAKKSNLTGILGFGPDNLFPQNLLNVLSDSVTAMACLSAKAEFIEANGFKNTELSKLIVHRSGLTLDRVLSRTAQNEAYFEAITLQIGYNGLGQVVSIRPIPTEFVRLPEPDEMGEVSHIAICPYLDSVYSANKKKEYSLLPLFNPDPTVVLQQIEEAGGIGNYKGQICYVPSWCPGDDFYHVPSYFPGIKAVESEGQLDIYDWRTITSGFNTSGILKVLSPAPVAGEEYDPLGDPNSIENSLADHQGAGNAASILVQRFDTLEDLNATTFMDTTGANLSDRYKSTTERTENRIVRAMRVPRELIIGGRVGGMSPTGIELEMATRMMQQSVNRHQRKITETFAGIMAHWHVPVPLDFTIENVNYFPDAAPAINAG